MAERKTLKRIQRELGKIGDEAPAGVSAGLVEGDNMFEWVATLPGPEGSPYAGGIFRVHVELPKDYPFKAPAVVMKTKSVLFSLPRGGASSTGKRRAPPFARRQKGSHSSYRSLWGPFLSCAGYTTRTCVGAATQRARGR